MAWLDGTSGSRTLSQLEAMLRAIVNATTAAALSIVQQANTSASTSVGGAFNIDNSLNTGPAAVFYSSQSAPAGRLFVVRSDSSTFNQAVVRFQGAGTAAVLDVAASGTGAGITASAPGTTGTNHALTAQLTGTGGTLASAANFASANTTASCVQITGVESGRGSLKIAHVGDNTVLDDQNASALSLDLRVTPSGVSTAAQGIFIDATTGGTDGPLCDWRNDSNLIFKVKTAATSDRTGATPHTIPILQMGATALQITMGTGSPEGVVTAPKASLYLRTDGGAGTCFYVKESGTGNTGWIAK